MIGSSYEGFTVAMGLIDPHPALKAAVPQGPLLDGWMGDDWFHYGAFRNMMLGYAHMQTGQRGAGKITPSDDLRQVRGVPARRLDGRLHPRERPGQAALRRTHDRASRLRRVLAGPGASTS